MAPTVEYHGHFEFALPPDAVWEGMEHTDDFESWWSWLHDFRHDGDRLTPGSVLRGVVEPPLPYRMQISVEIVGAERPRWIDAQVRGDLVGPAHLRLHHSDGGTTVDVDWELEMMQRPMRMAARFGRPLLQWGHDRVVEITVAGFRRRVEALPGAPT